MPNWVTCDYKESKYNSAVIDKIVNVTIRKLITLLENNLVYVTFFFSNFQIQNV